MSFSLTIRTAEEIDADNLTREKKSSQAWIAKLLTDTAQAITGDVPVSEQVSWPVKAASARAFLADEATPAQIADLQAEANLTDEAINDLAQAIVARAEAYAQAAAKMAGLRRRAENAVVKATTLEELRTAMRSLTDDIKTL